jgi:hypothetical protein
LVNPPPRTKSSPGMPVEIKSLLTVFCTAIYDFLKV